MSAYASWQRTASTFPVYSNPSAISGGMYAGVPHTVVLAPCVWTAQPKSLSFGSSYPSLHHGRPYSLADEDVFGFDVSVKDVLSVHVLQGRGDALDHPRRLLLRKGAVSVQYLLEIAVGPVFHDDVHIVVIPEVAIQADYILVTTVDGSQGSDFRWD